MVRLIKLSFARVCAGWFVAGILPIGVSPVFLAFFQVSESAISHFQGLVFSFFHDFPFPRALVVEPA